MPGFLRIALLALGTLAATSTAAAQCAFSLAPSSSTFPATGGDGQITITANSAGCSRTAVSNVPWITVTFGQSGTGNGTTGYNVQANTTSQSRTGTLTVAGQVFTVTQQPGTNTPACTFTISVPQIAGTGATVTVTITASTSTCDRTASSGSSWIRVTSGATGTGSGSVTIQVDANVGPGPRVGTLRINDFGYDIYQLGNSCQYSINPSGATIAQGGGTGTFTVTTTNGCAWTAASQSSWVTITAGASGTASGTVSYATAQNISPDARSGFITVAGLTFVLTQPGLGCSITIDTVPPTFGAEGGSGSIRIQALESCSWKAIPSDNWITIASSASGSGGGEVAYTVQPNTSVQTRTGSITVGSNIFPIRQGAGQCKVSIATTTGSFAANGGTGFIPISANCQWSASTSADWIQITSATSGGADATLSFRVQANSSGADRRGTITVNGQAFAIMQSAQRCSVSVASTQAGLPPRGGAANVSVSGGPTCTWSASSNAGWLRVEWTSVSGSGSVRMTADPNVSGASRTASVTVADQTVSVTQLPVVVELTANGIVNAASFASGAVAPGEIITVFGKGFGPGTLARLQLTSNGQAITTALADTQLLFDSVVAPMIYAQDGQLSAVVPYAVAGKQSTAVELVYLGVKSNAVMLSVSGTAPGIFTTASSGTGQAAVLNQDSTLNGTGSAAAARGSVIQIFATGEGQTRPAGVDGKLAAAPLPAPMQPVQVFIGGVEATVSYAGAAPGLLAGLLQVNAKVPDSVPAGSEVPIVIRIGNIESKAGPTVAIR